MDESRRVVWVVIETHDWGVTLVKAYEDEEEAFANCSCDWKNRYAAWVELKSSEKKPAHES